VCCARRRPPPQAAKYDGRPDVRARRIKTIEVDKRKQESTRAESVDFLAQWDAEPTTMERATAIANQDYCSRCYPLVDYPRHPSASQYEGQTSLWFALAGGIVDADQARDIAREMHGRVVAFSGRWNEHYDNRLACERAMLADAGGTIANKTGPEKGGAVRCWVGRGSWVYIQKVNKISVTLLDNWGNGGASFTRSSEAKIWLRPAGSGRLQLRFRCRDAARLSCLSAHEPGTTGVSQLPVTTLVGLVHARHAAAPHARQAHLFAWFNPTVLPNGSISSATRAPKSVTAGPR
jgi:hypothetical protein